jgi:hypothetical protein
LFFFTRQLEERKRMGEKEKFGHLLSSVLTSFVVAWSVVRHAKLPPTSSNSSNALLPAATTRISKAQEICCFQHEATGNRVFLELKMYCKEVVKAYVNGGHVVTTVSI